MKQFTILFIAAFGFLALKAQSTRRLENQKDAWGLTYIYTGEVKNGKPNGMGVAKYASGNVVRYAGSFVNGFYTGKGTMFFDNGAFLTGNWSNGKLNGKGTNLTADGTLYIGDFADGIKSGKGILIYKDNSFVKGGFKDDKLSGRCVNLWTDGNIISDIFYDNDKRNGMGYQYEAKSKTTYAGEWKDDKWVQSASPNFTSFIKSADFTGEATDKHVLMGPVNSKGFLKDTAYYYDLDKHRRYFGYYENGNLRNGLIIRDDSTRFMGPLDDVGAVGYCYDFKYKNYYSEGTYTNDHLDGQITDIDLVKKSVYYGTAVNGIFTGKAYFFNDNNALYAGDYLKGKFTGTGFRIESPGRNVAGTWQDGEPQTVTSITTADGEIIPGNPKTLQQALNIVIKDYTESFDNISGSLSDDDDWLDTFGDLDDIDSYNDIYNSLISFPGTTDKDKIESDLETTNLYVAEFINTKDADKAKVKYNEIAKQLMACSISNNVIKKAVKLKGTLKPASLSDDKTETQFDLPTDSDKYSKFHVWLILQKIGDDDYYTIMLKIGERKED